MSDESNLPTPQTLRSVDFLSTFSDVELSQIIALGRESSFEAHTNIVIEGELSWGLYIILEGTVGIYKTNQLNGENYDIGHLRAGNVFGELSLIDDNPRSATVRALTKTITYYIPKEQFKAYLEESAEIEHKFLTNCIRTLALMLREVNDKYVISQYQLWQNALGKQEISK